jgi:hypothetical protein
MWKRVILFILSGFTALVLIFIIVFSNEITSVIYRPYPYQDTTKNHIQQLWEITLGKKLSLLRETVSLCHLRGGKRIQTSPWFSKYPPTYECYLPYSDHDKPCYNSFDCQGECIIISPKIDYKTYSSPSEEPLLKEFNCTEETSHKNSSSKTYRCEKNSFKAQCAAFSWDQYDQWTINNNQINFIPTELAI